MGKKSDDKDERKLSGMSIISKVVTAILVVILVIVLFFYTIVDGILLTIVGFVKDLGNVISEEVKQISVWLGFASEYNTMQTYVLDDETVNSLRDTFEGVGIDTKASGLTEVRLRKILLANVCSTTFSDTLCAVPITTDEIVANEQEKDDSIKTFNDFKDKAEKRDSWGDHIWPISDPNYNLYYSLDSTKFFYFKDSDNILEPDGEDQYEWYIGVMGAITITTGSGSNLDWRSIDDFNDLKNQFAGNEAELLKYYTKVNQDEIMVYKLNYEQKEYFYNFENENLGGDNPLRASKLGDRTVTVDTQTISLRNDVDVSNYAISNELMLDLMDITGSGEFLETFIDYAINKIDIQIVAYTNVYTEESYDVTKYNVNRDSLIAEAYDMIKAVDSHSDNFLAYKSLIHNRKYNGSDFTSRVTDLPDFRDINYNGTDNGNGGTYHTDELYKYLDVAYDGNSSSIKSINVMETVATYSAETKCQVMPKSVDTWYGNLSYADPDQIDRYTSSNSGNELSEEEFKSFTFNKNGEYEDIANEEIKRIYIANDFAHDAGISSSGNIKNRIEVISSDWNNIANKTLWKSGAYDATEEDIINKTVYGLLQVGRNDGATYYNGALDESNYIYAKYAKENVKHYSPQTRAHSQEWERSNYTQTAQGMEAALIDFLAYLKNDTGEKPTVLTPQTFNKDGKVVMYGDIYQGQIAAGDLLLDNGAEMLFDLLERYDGTKKLVNVFKYMAYLYTGHDYGITSEDQLGSIFSLSGSAGFYGSTVEERVWFALINAGYSKELTAGIMGNIYQESNFDHTAVEPNGEGIRINTMVR